MQLCLINITEISLTSLLYSTVILREFIANCRILMASVYCCVGMYFLFVVILCAVSLAASIIVMYVHNRSGGMEATLTMPTWVCLPSKSSIHILYRFRRSIFVAGCIGMGRSIADVTQLSGKIGFPSPSVTLGHKSWTPLPKLRHTQAYNPLQKAVIIACRNKSDFSL